MSLTDVMCKKAQPQEKQYRLSDTNGLSLRIDPNGKKYWSIRYTENGQRKSKALGVYPELSLNRAREIALDLRYKLKNMVEAEVMQPHFQEVAEDWFNNQKETWSSKHISNVRASLDELYIALANKPINHIYKYFNFIIICFYYIYHSFYQYGFGISFRPLSNNSGFASKKSYMGIKIYLVAA